MWQELALGFIAGVASRAISTPLNIVTLRLQTESDQADYDDDEDTVEKSEPITIISVVKRIYGEQGIAGFWRGQNPLRALRSPDSYF